jgi:hypothetical protein
MSASQRRANVTGDRSRREHHTRFVELVRQLQRELADSVKDRSRRR